VKREDGGLKKKEAPLHHQLAYQEAANNQQPTNQGAACRSRWLRVMV